jgi:hypothetical protein
MRLGKTYFEQVPIEEAETVLRWARARAEELEKTPAPFQAPGRQAAEESLKEQESNPFKRQP